MADASAGARRLIPGDTGPRSGPIMLQPSERRLSPANHKTRGLAPINAAVGRSLCLSQPIMRFNESTSGTGPRLLQSMAFGGEPAVSIPTPLGSWVGFCFTLVKE